LVEANSGVLVVASTNDRAVEGNSVGLGSVTFLATPETLGQESVDVMALYAEYDCSTTARWRSLGNVGFAQGQSQPVFQSKTPSRWSVGSDQSIALVLWNAACHPTPSPYGALPEDLSTQSGRESALKKYRERAGAR